MKQILPDQIVTQVRQVLASQLVEPVEMVLFLRQENCETCADTQQLLEELVALSDKLFLSVHDIEAEADLARQMNVDKTPGIVLVGRDGEKQIDYGIRFAGVPSGYAFSTLINDLILVSGRDSKLQPMTRASLQNIKKPVLLQVFSTPT